MSKSNVMTHKQLQETLVSFEITVERSISFDEDAKKAGDSHNLKITFVFENVPIMDLVDDAVSRNVIKVQNFEKGKAPTAEAFADMLDKKGHHVTYNYKELNGKRKLSPMEKMTRIYQSLTPEQQEIFDKMRQAEKSA